MDYKLVMGGDELVALNEESLKNKIYNIKGQQVMVDSDLAELYDVSTKVLNQAIKRNIERFPKEFMFRLKEQDLEILRSQIVTSNESFNSSLNQKSLRSQNETLETKSNLRFQTGTSRYNHGGHRSLPYVFTEQGVAMLSGGKLT